MHFFFTSNEVSSLVDSIVRNNPIPKYQSVSVGDKIIAGVEYAYGKSIIKCTTTGVIGDGATYDIETRNYLSNDEVNMIDNEMKNIGLKNSYSSTDVYYNSELHEKLGDYLRHYKSKTGINLMPYYNCFSYRSANDIYIGSDGTVKSGSSGAYKVFLVPIRLNTTYTICVDASMMSIAPVIYSDGKIIASDYGKLYYSTSFSRPVYVRYDKISSSDDTGADVVKDGRLYRNIYLVLQLPKDNQSSIAIIEGEYKHKRYNAPLVTSAEATGSQLDGLNMQSRLKLMEMNDRTVYAFSDRLLEYLTGNVVDSADETQQDVDRVIEAVSKNGLTVDNRLYDDALRSKVYWIVTNKDKYLYDINGYADKDSEFLLGME